MKHILIVLVLCLGFFGEVQGKKKIDLAKYLGDKAAHFERDMDKLLENWNIPFRSWKLKVYPRKKNQSNGDSKKGCSCGGEGGDPETTEAPSDCPCKNGGGGGAPVAPPAAPLAPGAPGAPGAPQTPALPNTPAAPTAGGYRPGSPQDPAYNRCKFTPQVCMCGDKPPGAAGAATTAAAGAAGAATTVAPAAAGAATTAAAAAAAGGDAAAATTAAAAAPAGVWMNNWSARRNLQYPYQFNGNQQFYSPPEPQYNPYMQQQYPQQAYSPPAPQQPVGAESLNNFHEHLNKAADFMNKAAEKLKAYGASVNSKDDGEGDDEGDKKGGCSCEGGASSETTQSPCGPCGADAGAGAAPAAGAPAAPAAPQQPVPGTPQIWNTEGGNNAPAGKSQLQAAAAPPIDPECEKKKNVYCDRICDAFSGGASSDPNTPGTTVAPGAAAAGAAGAAGAATTAAAAAGAAETTAAGMMWS